MSSRLSKFVYRKFDHNGVLYKILKSARHPAKSWSEIRRRVTRSSIFQDEDDLHACSLLPEVLLQGVFDLVRPKAVLDVGCGTGKSLDWFMDQGVEVLGFEGSELAISRSNHPERIERRDLNLRHQLDRRFDLVWCFEVAEHIHPRYVHNFVGTLVAHSDVIFMSAAHPGQGGTGHFNEQPRSYWIALMRDSGYDHDDAGCAKIIQGWTWYPENVFLFRKMRAA